MKTCSYGVVVSTICNILSIAEFVAVMRDKITTKIGARGSQNLAVVRITRWPYQGVLIQEIKYDFAWPKSGGRNYRVAVRRGSTVRGSLCGTWFTVWYMVHCVVCGSLCGTWFTVLYMVHCVVHGSLCGI